MTDVQNTTRTILPADTDPWLVAIVQMRLLDYMGNPEGDLPWWMVVRNYVSTAGQFGHDEEPDEVYDSMLEIAAKIWARSSENIGGPGWVPDDAASERQEIAVQKFMAIYEWMVQDTALASGSDGINDHE